jgi:hypothetical protein
MRSNKGNRSIELVPNLERIMGRQSEITSIPEVMKIEHQ